MTYWAPPIVARGTGPLTGGALHQVVEAAHQHRAQQAAVQRMLQPDYSTGITHWVGLITASLSIATRRWRYTLQRQILLDALAAQAHPDIRFSEPAAGTGLVYGYNLAEWQQPTVLLGDGVQVAHIPAGFAVVPVVGLVQVTSTRTLEGNILHIFDRANGIDGTCP